MLSTKNTASSSRQSIILPSAITLMAIGNTAANAMRSIWSSKTVVAGVPIVSLIIFSLVFQYGAALILWCDYFIKRRSQAEKSIDEDV